MTTEEIAEEYWAGHVSDDDRRSTNLLIIPSDGLVEVADAVYFKMGFGNMTVINTFAGLVLIDSGTEEFGQHLYEDIKIKFPKRWIVACIYTHGHVDHVAGMNYIQQKQTEAGGPKIKVYGHKNITYRFDRYCTTCGYNAHINTRQFGGYQKDLRSSYSQFIHPEVTYEDQMTVEIGGTVFQLHHDKGETDDSTWVFIPSVHVLIPGDLFIWNIPNCGNPQKVQRYPREWAIALQKMSKFNAELMLPGHGPLIRGRDRINRALLDTSIFLQEICDQTISYINMGMPLDDILQKVKFNEELMQKPYLRPLYDDPIFIIHNLWRQFAGWWDFQIHHLKTVSESELAKETAKLYPDVNGQLEHIEKLLSDRKIKLAIHFMEMAYKANQTNPLVLEARIKVLEQCEEGETSLMAKNIIKYEINLTQTKLDELNLKAKL